MNHKTFTIIGLVLATVLFIISCVSTAAEQHSVSHTAHYTWYEIKQDVPKQRNTSSLCYLANSPTKCYRCTEDQSSVTISKLPLKVTIFKPFSIGLKPIALSRG